MRMSLNGGWTMTHTVASMRLPLAKVKNQLERNPIPALVPGDAHLDLMRAGLIPDPFFGLDADHCLWMEGKDWWYSRRFAAPEEMRGRRLRLVFGGLDCFAEIYLNDELLATSENMFVPLEVDVTRKVVFGAENELLVKLGSPIFSAPVPSERPEFVAGNDAHAAYTRKAAMSYAWDIAPRLLTVGIWKEVSLVAYGAARIADVCVRTAMRKGDKVELAVSAVIERLGAACEAVEVKLDFASQALSRRVALDQPLTTVEWTLTLDDARLWWPNGLGEPFLYDWKLALEQDGEILDTRSGRHGIREIELVQGAAAGRGA